MKTIKFIFLILMLAACSKEDVTPKSTPSNKKYTDLSGRWKYSDTNGDIIFSGEFDLLIKGDSVIPSNGFIINNGVKSVILRYPAYKMSDTPINLVSVDYLTVDVEHQFSNLMPAPDYKKFTGIISITNDSYRGGLNTPVVFSRIE